MTTNDDICDDVYRKEKSSLESEAKSMKNGRSQNVIRNVKWGILLKAVTIVLPFVVRTVLIYILGAEYAGLSSLFASILTIVCLSELGFSSAIVYSMYKPVAENDKKKICALLSIYKKAYRIIGCVILVAGLALLPFLPHLIHDEIPDSTNLYILFLVYLSNTVLSYFLFAYQTSLLSAYQREDIVSRNSILQNIFLYTLQLLTLIIFKNYYVYAVVLPLSTIVLNLLNHRTVLRMFPGYEPEGDISAEDKKELKKNLIGLMISKAGDTTRETFDSVVISMYLGLVLVAMFNNYMYIIIAVKSFFRVIATSMVASVGNKIATQSPEQNYTDFCFFHFVYMWLAGWCTVCMMCLYQPFMKLWMGETLMFPNYIMFMFCYYFLMIKQGDINGVYYQAAGLWWHGKTRSIIEALLNLSLKIVLGKYYGVTGIIAATIISFTCVYFYGSKFVFTEYFRNDGLKWFYIRNFLYMLTTFAVGFATYYVVGRLTVQVENTIGVLLIGALVCIIMPNLLFAAVYGMFKTNRDHVKSALRLVKISFRS